MCSGDDDTSETMAPKSEVSGNEVTASLIEAKYSNRYRYNFLELNTDVVSEIEIPIFPYRNDKAEETCHNDLERSPEVFKISMENTKQKSALRRNILGISLAVSCGLLFSLSGYCIKQFGLEFAELLIVRSVIQVRYGF